MNVTFLLQRYQNTLLDVSSKKRCLLNYKVFNFFNINRTTVNESSIYTVTHRDPREILT